MGLLTVDPRKRLTIEGIKQHSWCMTCVLVSFKLLTTRPSQLTREQIPEALTQGMRTTGMMSVADPTFTAGDQADYAVEYVSLSDHTDMQALAACVREQPVVLAVEPAGVAVHARDGQPDAGR